LLDPYLGTAQCRVRGLEAAGPVPAGVGGGPGRRRRASCVAQYHQQLKTPSPQRLAGSNARPLQPPSPQRPATRSAGRLNPRALAAA